MLRAGSPVGRHSTNEGLSRAEVQLGINDFFVFYYPMGTVKVSLYSSWTNLENYILGTLDILTQVPQHVPSPEL